MIPDFPSVSFLRKTFLPALAVLAGVICAAFPLCAAPLLIVTEPGAKAVFKAAEADQEAVALGIADADGILLVPEAPGVAGTLTLTHADAVAPAEIAYDPAKTPGKISPELKLRPASLMISALPAEEVEIFVDGKHCGRGAVTIGGVVPRKKVTVEARSVRRGMQSRVISAEPGDVLPVKFDLRGNEVSDRPDGQIILPELPRVLASQTGALVRADGVVVEFDSGKGMLIGLEPGERLIEIFLPWEGREVCVYRAGMPARSAMLPGADIVAAPNPPRAPAPEENPPSAETPAGVPAPAAAEAEGGRVLFSIGGNVTVSLGAKSGLKNGDAVSVIFGGASSPVPVSVSGVTPTQAILRLPDGVPAPDDGTPCRLAETSEK